MNYLAQVITGLALVLVTVGVLALGGWQLVNDKEQNKRITARKRSAITTRNQNGGRR